MKWWRIRWASDFVGRVVVRTFDVQAESAQAARDLVREQHGGIVDSVRELAVWERRVA